MSENCEKIYIIEIKIVSLLSLAGIMGKKRELKIGREFLKLLKTNTEKMSVFRLSIMLKKTNELDDSLHYVDEKKGNY